jgi:radical SAM family uncharacterized protein
MKDFSYIELLKLKKPGQYLNSEFNSISKKEGEVKAVLIYPDLYEVGLPNLGLQILYFLGNSLEWALVDRAFAPERDLAEKIEQGIFQLKGIESKIPVKNFDVVGFTLQSELTYTTALKVMKLSGIPLFFRERRDEDPLVIAGGPGALNPFPLFDFIDVFVAGDGEIAFIRILELLRDLKKRKAKRLEILEAIDYEVESSFIPAFYKVERGSFPRTISAIEKTGGRKEKITAKRAVVGDISPYLLEKQIVPNVSAAHERAQIEIARGCRRGCRFCQAGFIYRPVREASVGKLAEYAQKVLLNTGFEELGFVTLSASDYSRLNELLTLVYPFCEERKITISLPSLRMDSFSVSLANLVSSGRKTTLTFAPEAGTERLRSVINKNLSEKEIEEALSAAYESNYQKIKLYFMIGLPTEEKEDLEGIVSLIEKAVKLGEELLPKSMKHRLRVNVSVSTFVPKPHTPFQWEAQTTPQDALEKAEYIRSGLRSKKVKLSFHNHHQAAVEGLIARGGPETSGIIFRAYELGASFDGWDDRFRFEIWENASGGVCDYLQEIPLEALLPWEVIDTGIEKRFLIEERNRAYDQKMTPACRSGCIKCGVCKEVPLKEASG